jgi:uncharacterized membrane protein YdfJ with MMPL/SSD domain
VSAAGEFRVVPEDLVTHAEHVAEAAARMGRAVAAGETVRPDARAYGALGSFLPRLLDPFQLSVAQSLRRCADTLDSAADALRQTADTYRAGDNAAADGIASVHRLLREESGEPSGDRPGSGTPSRGRRAAAEAVRGLGEGMRLPGTGKDR